MTAVVVVAAEPENGVKRRRKVAGSGSDTSQEGIERSYEEKGMLWMHPQHPGMTAGVYSGVVVVAASLGSDLGTTGSFPLEPVASTFHHPGPSAAAAAAGPVVVAVVDDVAASVAESAAAAFAALSRVQRLLHSSPCFPQLRPLLGSELMPA